MNWLKDFFFCETWAELLFMSVLAAAGLIVMWALIAMAIILFG